MSALTHEFSFKLPVTAQHAFAALTHADELKFWFAEFAEVEPRPGDANRSIVKGRHVFSDPPNIGRAKEMVVDLWRLQCGNLKAYAKAT